MTNGMLGPDGRLSLDGKEGFPSPAEMPKSAGPAWGSSARFANESNSQESSVQTNDSGSEMKTALVALAWNALWLILLVYTAYSHFKILDAGGVVSGESWIHTAYKTVAVAWFVGLVLMFYSKVKTAPVEEPGVRSQLDIMNKYSTVMLAVPFVIIAAIIIIIMWRTRSYGQSSAAVQQAHRRRVG